MNKLKFTLALTALVLAALAVTGCKPEDDSVSVKERMNMFIEDANAGSFDSLKEHTHPAATSYNLASAAYWTAFFPGINTNPLIILSISGTTANVSGCGMTFTFTLLEDDDDVYKIRTIDSSGLTDFN